MFRHRWYCIASMHLCVVKLTVTLKRGVYSFVSTPRGCAVHPGTVDILFMDNRGVLLHCVAVRGIRRRGVRGFPCCYRVCLVVLSGRPFTWVLLPRTLFNMSLLDL
eukprot:jgi/Botrbrau1/21561/Bobra.174_2s0060.1